MSFCNAILGFIWQELKHLWNAICFLVLCKCCFLKQSPNHIDKNNDAVRKSNIYNLSADINNRNEEFSMEQTHIEMNDFNTGYLQPRIVSTPIRETNAPPAIPSRNRNTQHEEPIYMDADDPVIRRYVDTRPLPKPRIRHVSELLSQELNTILNIGGMTPSEVKQAIISVNKSIKTSSSGVQKGTKKCRCCNGATIVPVHESNCALRYETDYSSEHGYENMVDEIYEEIKHKNEVTYAELVYDYAYGIQGS